MCEAIKVHMQSHSMQTLYWCTYEPLYLHKWIVCIQSIAWERWQRTFTGKVFLYCTIVQFFVVRGPRILVHNAHKHLMGVLDILQVSYSSADWVRDEGPWSWSLHTWLGCCGIILIQPSYLTLLCHCQCLCRLRINSICCYSYSLLGPQCVQCQ